MKSFSILSIFISFFLLTNSCQGTPGEKTVFIVQRNGRPLPAHEETKIVIPWSNVRKYFLNADEFSFKVTELNFGKEVAVHLIDVDKNHKPESLVLNFTFTSNEPVYTFQIESSKTKISFSSAKVEAVASVVITFLKPATQLPPVQDWPATIAGSTMSFYPDVTKLSINAPGQWNYECGFYLGGVMRLYEKTRDEKYYKYVRQWADHFIDAKGNMDTTQYNVAEYKLDDILPGRLFLFLYAITKEEKYRNAADQLMDHLHHQPKTSEGGYWHKKIYPYQMWLDGIYMADVFTTQYAKQFNQPALFDEAINQILLISKHTLDANTGLMYHGWDESKNKTWADQQTGTSPEFWGRAIGWYMMALSECLDNIPADHPQRKALIAVFQNLANSLLKYQDPESSLWYQVVNKGSERGNWIETSCSAMFAYAFAKGHHQGVLKKEFFDNASKVFGSIVNDYVYFDDEHRMYLTQTVKVGTLNPKSSKGDFAYYVSTERRINDYKGLAPFLLLSLELSEK